MRPPPLTRQHQLRATRKISETEGTEKARTSYGESHRVLLPQGRELLGGRLKYLAKGNTERVAEFVQEAVGGDLFEIETAKPYSADYYRCIEEAKTELQADARPELAGYLEDAGLNIDDYDTIFLGYPNWWGTCPMCVFTFLEHYDLAGKRIVPFCTNEGSGVGGSVKHLKRICPDATIETGLSITGNCAVQSREKVQAWAAKFA